MLPCCVLLISAWWGGASCVSLQICSPASMGVNVCTQPSVTADASMPLGRAARWVGLSSISPLGWAMGAGKAVGLSPGGSGLLGYRDNRASGLVAPAATQRGSLFLGSVYNAGPERDSICRAWGQHHVETFDGLYYYLSGKGSYTLVGRREPEGQTFSVQVRLPLPCLPRKAPLGSGGWVTLSVVVRGLGEITEERNLAHTVQPSALAGAQQGASRPRAEAQG